MKIEIWSDIICPFCYIGKRKFEAALESFEHRDQIEVVWKSFQLNPDMKTEPGKNINQYLAEIKGWPLEQAEKMNRQVTETAKAAGLNYNFDKAVIVNSFDAHRLIQLAKKHYKGDVAEEHLFKAYFTEGKNVDDPVTLIQLGTDIGLDSMEVKKMLESSNYTDEVKKDIDEAQQAGVRGVPFFVIDRKYAVSGVQESAVFTQALKKAWEERK